MSPLQGRCAGRGELIEFWQRGCGLRRSSLVGLRRRNNELNELTNCRAARVRGIAPEGAACATLPNLGGCILNTLPFRGSVRRNPRHERPERAASSQPRATPWVSIHKRLRPVRAKVWANGWLLLLPLQGVGNGDMEPRALPWAGDLLGFQPAQGRSQSVSKQSPPT